MRSGFQRKSLGPKTFLSRPRPMPRPEVTRPRPSLVSSRPRPGLEDKARPRGQRYCIMHGYVSSNTSSAEQEVTIRVTDNTVLTTEKRCLKYPESAFTHASLSNGSCVIQLAHSNIHSESKNCATIHSFTTSTNVGRFCYKTRTIDPRAAAVSRRKPP